MEVSSSGYRSAEFDPLGQDVGWYDRVDRLVVSQSHFMQEINSGAIGGAFGLLEIKARMSAQPPRLQSLQVGNMLYRPNLAGANLAIDEQIETGGTIIRNIIINDSWSLSSSLFSFTERPLAQQQKDSPLSATAENTIKNGFDNRLKRNKGNCKAMLNKLVAALGGNFSNDDGSLTGIEALADKFLNNPKYKMLETSSSRGVADYANRTIRFQNGNTDNANSFNFIHELLHAVGGNTGFSHQNIVEKIASIEGLNLSDFSNDLKDTAKAKAKSGELKKLGLSKGDYIEGEYRDVMNDWIGNYCTNEGGYQKWKNFAQNNR